MKQAPAPRPAGGQRGQQPVRHPRQRAHPPRPAPAIPPAPGRQRGCLYFFALFILLSCGMLTVVTAATGALLYARLDTLVDQRLAQFADYRAFESTFIYARNRALADGSGANNAAGHQGCPAQAASAGEHQLLYELFGEGRRQPALLEEMPPALLQATLATEDEAFYRHFGIDIPATLQAAWRYLTGNRRAPGGSTIHQQLVRNVLFAPEYRAERSVRRKIEEIALALALDRRYSKDRILEMYLNEIYFGNLAYGVQAAAQTFFCKDVSELSVGEAALLAGLPQAPAWLDPLSADPATREAVHARWQTVLAAMVENGYLSEAERERITAAGLVFQRGGIALQAPHFTIHLLDELAAKMGELGYEPDFTNYEGTPIYGGLRVYGTIDTRLNALAERAIIEQICASSAQDIGNGAALVLKPATGEVLAMVGSANYFSRELDATAELVAYERDAGGACQRVHVVDGQVNVTTRARQPGSAIKPLTYAAALERGVLHPGTVLWDTETRIASAGQPDYEPRNYDGHFHGPMTMRAALANSYNIPAVQTLRALGLGNLLETAHRFGIESLGDDTSKYGLSLTLGGGEVTLLELTRAYSVFANEGRLLPTRAIRCIMRASGHILYQLDEGCPGGQIVTAAMLAGCAGEAQADYCALNAPSQLERSGGQPVLDERIAYLIRDILSDNAARAPAMGANSPLHIPELSAAVKTGTTDNFKDNWTIGTTANVTVGIWVGNTRGEPMRDTSGLSGAAPIWREILRGIYGDEQLLAPFRDAAGALRPEQPAPPAAMTRQRICDARRLQEPATHCAATTSEWFLDTPPARLDEQGQWRATGISPPQVPASGDVEMSEVSPGVYSLRVQPLPAVVGAAIDFGLPPAEAPPPPLYCQLPRSLATSAPGAQTRLFLLPPPFADDAIAAERYARENGLAFLPTIVCTPELISLARSHTGQIVTAHISRPYDGEAVRGGMAIIGSVQFTAEQAQFYKLELRGGPYADWITLGDIHSRPVSDGQLEWLPALPAGNYRLRLVVVGWDGNFVQAPHEIGFTVP